MPILIVLFLMIVASFLLYSYVGGKMNASDISGYAQQAGFTGDDLTVAVAIALAESSGNPNAVGDNGQSIGLWQIYTTAHPEFNGWNLKDPAVNAQAAFSVYQAAGNSFMPWSTFKSGAYAQYLGDASVTA